MRMTRITRWGLIALVWALVSTIQTTFLFEMWRDYGKPRPWIEIARQPFVAYFLMWGLIATPLVLFLCKRFPVERRNWPHVFYCTSHFRSLLAYSSLSPAYRFIHSFIPHLTNLGLDNIQRLFLH